MGMSLIKKYLSWGCVFQFLVGGGIFFGGVAVFLWAPRDYPLVGVLRHPNQDYVDILKVSNKFVFEKDKKKRDAFMYSMRDIWLNQGRDLSKYFSRLPRDDYLVLTDEDWGVPLCVDLDLGGGFPRDGTEMTIEKRTLVNGLFYACDYKFRGTDPFVGWAVLGILLLSVGFITVICSFSYQKTSQEKEKKPQEDGD